MLIASVVWVCEFCLCNKYMHSILSRHAPAHSEILNYYSEEERIYSDLLAWCHRYVRAMTVAMADASTTEVTDDSDSNSDSNRSPAHNNKLVLPDQMGFRTSILNPLYGWTGPGNVQVCGLSCAVVLCG